MSNLNWVNPADKYANRPGHWTMSTDPPHNCVHCGKGYNQHNPWPELPCPKTERRELSKSSLHVVALLVLVVVLFLVLFAPDHPDLIAYGVLSTIALIWISML